MTFHPPNTEARAEFYDKLLEESPDPESWEYEIGDKHEGMRNVHPIDFGAETVAIEDLVEYLETVENRLNLAKFCLREISEVSESFEVEQSEVVSLEELQEYRPDGDIQPEFVIRVEYFIFATRSLLDTLAQIINLGYGFGLDSEDVNIFCMRDKLQRQDIDLGDEIDQLFSNELENFNSLRNRMTHHYMFNQISSNSHPLNDEDSYEIHTRAFEVDFSEGNSERFILPDYFEEVYDAIYELVDEAFSYLNKEYEEPSRPDGNPMWSLLHEIDWSENS